MKNTIIIIAGPTGVGKTKTSIELAKKLNTEIISCDSMQIYKYMDIGTDKILENEKEGIIHHQIDFIDPRNEYTVSDYAHKTSIIIKSLLSKNSIPIIVGGTGLYINSLIYEMDFGKVNKNNFIREKYINILQKEGKDALYKIYLQRIDKNKVNEKIHPNNLKRLIRFLEISEVNEDNNTFTQIKKKTAYSVKLFVLNRNREKLYQNINNRVDDMIKNGLISEVKELRRRNILLRGTQASEAIGYKEIIQYLDGKTNIEEAIRLIKRNSRRYAKRQLTWFRRYNFAEWIDIDNLNIEQIVNKISNNL